MNRINARTANVMTFKTADHKQHTIPSPLKGAPLCSKSWLKSAHVVPLWLVLCRLFSTVIQGNSERAVFLLRLILVDFSQIFFRTNRRTNTAISMYYEKSAKAGHSGTTHADFNHDFKHSGTPLLRSRSSGTKIYLPLLKTLPTLLHSRLFVTPNLTTQPSH